MPNAYINGIAQNQAAAPSSPYDANKPWEFTYRGGARPVPFGRRDKHPTIAGDEGQGSAQWMSGPQGVGYYQASTADQNALGAQQYYANQFRKGLPDLENKVGSQLAGNVNAQMDQGFHDVRQHNSARGMLYGGVDAGQEQRVRSAAAGSLAQGRSSINQGLLSAADKMDGAAIDTGLQIQQQQQQIQNDIYSQALGRMNGVQSAVGGVLGAAGAVAGAYFGGAAGGMAGYQAGTAAGRSI